MKKVILYLSTIFSFVFASESQAQDKAKEKWITKRNSIGLFAGTFDGNLYYERNLAQMKKSYINARLGAGYFSDLQNEGSYSNLLVSYLWGRKQSHLEIGEGVRLVMNGTRHDYEGKQTWIMNDFYIGYRLERPEGKFVFRAGLSTRSLINVGVGVKF